MGRLGLGVIGTGDRAIGYLRKIFGQLQEDKRARIVGVADINPVRAEEGRKDLLAEKAFTDHRRLLEEPALDAVFVMTPDAAHAPIVLDALTAGKHVFCEKPMATTVEDCRAIVQAARDARGIFFAGHNVRYGATGRTIHRLILEGKIGRLRMVWARRFVEGAKYWHRWHRERRNSGGLLVHKGCHYLDQMNWHSGGRPKYVAAFGGMDVHVPRPDAPRRCLECKDHCPHYIDLHSESGDRRMERYFLNAEKHDGYLRDRCVYAPGADVFDNAVVAVEYTNGVRGTYMECHFAPISDRQTEVGAVGDKGLLVYTRTQDGKSALRFEDSATRQAEDIPWDTYRPVGDEAVIRDFVACAERGEPPESGYEAGWDSAMLGLTAQEAAARRRTMELCIEERTFRPVD